MADTATLAYTTWDKREEQVRFDTGDASARLRTYTQSSTARMRDDGPASVTYRELDGMPTVRSGNLAFDALFALAVNEMKKNAVSEIRDDSYNGGKAIACDCFETGEKWHYVWTRDVSYAASLGLAMLDPRRARNSLAFKLSGYRSGRSGVAKPAGAAGSEDGLQIIQDTGSGGSWPVSTDRVSWAFGAEEVLNALPPHERKAFAATALKALRNTIENDRLAAFDAHDSLYTGEQSFLDWREQTYAAWIVDDLASMASSKALSTNVAHFKALTLAAQLAQEQGDAALAQRYAAWAAQLKTAINAKFWLADAGMYSSLTAGQGDGAPLHKFDWLGQSLAIITGVADAAKAKRILARYPHGSLGAPVVYPQQPGVPIYHNRAIWPFVTAFGLQAAATGKNVSVADAAYQTLMRSAALNLSNMENMEWLSGEAMWHDPRNPVLDGPVINSRRQLWSVGAYLGMVIRNVFGVATTRDGIAVRPFVTGKLRKEVFGAASRIVLDDVRIRGKKFGVVVVLPPVSDADGYYAVDAIMLNGRKVSPAIAWKQLRADNLIEVRLGALVAGQQAIHHVDGDPLATDGANFAPFEAEIGSVARNASGAIAVEIRDAKNAAGATAYQLYRNGKLVADRLPTGTWLDVLPAATLDCYTVEAISTTSGNRSHHSMPACFEPETDIPLADAGSTADVDIERAGRYQFQVRYRNLANSITAGVTNGVKLLTIHDEAGKLVASSVVQMPHTRDGTAHYSTPAKAQLGPGRYRIALGDFINMSYLQSNASFNGPGGTDGPLNRPDMYSLRMLIVHP